jgi:hypothetical protein
MLKKHFIIFFIFLFISWGCIEKRNQNVFSEKDTSFITKTIETNSTSAQLNKNEEQKINASKYLVLKKDFWRTDEYHIYGLLDISIINKGQIDYKDVVIKIKYYAESGTYLSQQTKTLYKIFPVKKIVTINDINTGFAPEGARYGVVSIIDALPLN